MIIKKMIWFVLIAIVVLLVLLVTGVIRGMDEVAKNVIEAKGSMVTGTDVTLDSIQISLLNQSVKVHKLVIANPEGFDSPYVFSMKEMSLKMDAASLLGAAIIFDDILFDGVDIVVEQKNMTSNIQILGKFFQNTSDEGLSVSEYVVNGTDDQDLEGANTARLMAIRNLSFTNVKLTLITEGQEDYTLNVSDIIMTNMGPVDPERLGAEIMLRLAMQSQQIAEEMIKGRLADGGLSMKRQSKKKERLDKLRKQFN